MKFVSERYADLIRRGYDAWNAGDRSWVLEHLSPDVEWITPPDDPDPGHYRGHDAVISFWDQWRAAVGQLEFEILELIEAQPHVLVITRRSGTGTHSGLPVSDEVCQVFTFDGELCVKVQEFYDRAAAMRAAGSPAGVPGED
jgi:ketosteroid isomerase-like protein